MSVTVLIKADRPVSSYESFALPDPPRLVIDIPDAVHAVAEVEGAKGPVKEIRISQYKTKPVQVVRIVLDLTAALPYQVESAPGPLKILIGEAVAKAVKPDAPVALEAEVPPKAEPPAMPQVPAKEEPPIKAEAPAEVPAKPEIPPKAEPPVIAQVLPQVAPAEAEPPAMPQVPPQPVPAKEEPPQKAETPLKAEVPPAPPQPAVAPEAIPEGQVTAVEYRPKAGQGEILIRTTGRVAFNVAEVTDPPGLILDVGGAVIDPQAAKTLEVSQLPGPVQRIQAAQYRGEPDKVVRVAAELKGKVRYEVVQTPEGISLGLQALAAVAAPPTPLPQEAAPPPAAPAPPAPPVAVTPSAEPRPQPAAAPSRLSMDFKDADINNLLRIIAEVSGQNIVAGEDVKGKVTVRLISVPWDKALDTILRINGFGFIQEENIIRVAKLDALRKEQDQQRKDQQEAVKLKEEAVLEPLQTEILRVSYAKPDEVVKTLERVKTRRGTISVDQRTATLIVQDTESSIKRMRVLLEELDKATPQVMIEGRIVTVDSSHTRELGVTWGAQRTPTSADIRAKRPTTQLTISDIFGGGTASAAGTVPATLGIPSQGFASSIPVAVNAPTVKAPIGAFGMVLGTLDNQLKLGFKLSALEREAKARTLSTPRIVALDNQEAEIKQGTEEPFTTVDSSGKTTIAFKEAVLSLKVTPHVTADRRVSMKVLVTNDDVKERISVGGVGDTPVINRRTATSSLLVDDGTTFVIGGIRKTKENVEENRVPFLGEIPILGWLFKNRIENLQPETTELLIFITPTIIEEARRAQR
jgi:type IV pilus assembly protein PilQ